MCERITFRLERARVAPPAALITTARPQAIASAMTRPNGSGFVLACTTTSSDRSALARREEAGEANALGEPELRSQPLQLHDRYWLPAVS